MPQPKLSPYIRIAWDNWASSLDWYVDRRVIFDYEIIYLESGELELVVEGTGYRVLPGDIILLRPKQHHSIRSVGNTLVHQPHIHFDLVEDEFSPHVYISFASLDEINPREYVLFRKDILDEFCPNLPPVLRLRKSKNIEGLLMAIIREKEKRMIHSDVLANGLFLQLFATLMREVTLNSKDDDDHESWPNVAQQVRDILNESLDRDFSLEELSDRVHVSKYHLCRQFKQSFGVSPIQYHLDSRIDKAKELLVTTNMSISDIAETVGFQSIYSFSRAFKKRENIPPSIYRR